MRKMPFANENVRLPRGAFGQSVEAGPPEIGVDIFPEKFFGLGSRHNEEPPSLAFLRQKYNEVTKQKPWNPVEYRCATNNLLIYATAGDVAFRLCRGFDLNSVLLETFFNSQIDIWNVFVSDIEIGHSPTSR